MRPIDTHDFQAAKDASSSKDNLIDLFNRIERFFGRLEIYTSITPTTAMKDIIIEIMVEVLAILAIATKEVKRGRFSEFSQIDYHPRVTRCLDKYLKKLTGTTDIEDSLSRLDKLTQEEARMASAELLKMTHCVDDRVKSVEGKVQEVRSDVHDVGNKVEGMVQDVDDKVQGIDSNIKHISSGVQGVDDKLDQVNRSLSL